LNMLVGQEDHRLILLELTSHKIMTCLV
jgi:hypothetical protein